MKLNNSVVKGYFMTCECIRLWVENNNNSLPIRKILLFSYMPTIIVLVETLHWGFYNVLHLPFPIPLVLWIIFFVWAIILIRKIRSGVKLSFQTRQLYVGSCCGITALGCVQLAIYLLVAEGDVILFTLGVLLLIALTFISTRFIIRKIKESIASFSQDYTPKKRNTTATFASGLTFTFALLGMMTARTIFRSIPDDVVQNTIFGFGILTLGYIFFFVICFIHYYSAYLIHKYKLTSIKIAD